MVKRLANFLKHSYLGLVLLFMYAPIAILILFSFTDSRTEQVAGLVARSV